MKKALLFSLLLTIAACSHVDLSLTDQTRIYTDAPVRKSALQVSVHPKGRQYTPLTAYFHPFIIQQESPDHAALSASFTQIFFNVWTEERLFSTMELAPGYGYQGYSSALESARRRGADLLVIGKVPYFYDGTTLDDSAVTIQVDVYAAGSGTLLWTMIQSSRIEQRDPEDFVVVVHETRMSHSPFNQMIRAIARDMAVPLKSWLPDPDSRFPYASTPEAVKSGLMAGPTDGAQGADLPPETSPAPAVSSGPAAGQPARGDAEDEAARTGEDATPRPGISGVDLDIQFDFDKATIKPESHAVLDALGETLNSPEFKGKSIVVGGHTDASGDARYNLDLSKKRADAVKAYLVDKWRINPDLIEAVGFGKSRPLTAGTTAADQQRNRRVEIRLADQALQ
ncbi:Outer membrane porin F precursor [Pseudodesulfovibrio hydrargyri]|uniref:Outer membrane porin F n=1 Tax=Pseudodesulfovibrio hydrargyri TaxID=2125990 RepID=A0A1J5MXM6_9BACT|nr:OmpA family protein [Pseudodesulfovibrio hydrargyri]OIQ51286.1 Outer membrane porin F precursor [Pseudodesulfovibrio hydrargyri]